jgi:hypothetical protein
MERVYQDIYNKKNQLKNIVKISVVILFSSWLFKEASLEYFRQQEIMT